DDLPAVVEGQSLAACTAERPEVCRAPVRPERGVLGASARHAPAGDLAPVVDCDRAARAPAERPEGPDGPAALGRPRARCADGDDPGAQAGESAGGDDGGTHSV